VEHSLTISHYTTPDFHLPAYQCLHATIQLALVLALACMHFSLKICQTSRRQCDHQHLSPTTLTIGLPQHHRGKGKHSPFVCPILVGPTLLVGTPILCMNTLSSDSIFHDGACGIHGSLHICILEPNPTPHIIPFFTTPNHTQWIPTSVSPCPL
jgi:hypothetical protein